MKLVLGFPGGLRLIWLGGRHVRVLGEDVAARLILQAEVAIALAGASTDDGAIRDALCAIPGASVILGEGDLRRRFG